MGADPSPAGKSMLGVYLQTQWPLLREAVRGPRRWRVAGWVGLTLSSGTTVICVAVIPLFSAARKKNGLKRSGQNRTDQTRTERNGRGSKEGPNGKRGMPWGWARNEASNCCSFQD